MERLDFTDKMQYNAEEAAIHLSRYLLAKPYVKDKCVLDAACGEGYGSRLMMDWGATEVTGVDISEEGIEKAKKLFEEEHLRFLVHSAEKLPFSDDSFDMVVSLETIEHLDHPEAFLKEIVRVLKPGGAVILSCPNDAYYARMDENYSNLYHKRRYSFQEFEDMSVRYLGTNVKWGMCYALGGFVILGENCVGQDGPKTASMLQLMQNRYHENAYILPQMETLTAEKSNFYVGIWNAGKEFDSFLACYPQAYFAVPERIPYQYAALAQQNSREFLKVQMELEASNQARCELSKANEELQATNHQMHCELEQIQTQLEESNQARCELSKANEELQAANHQMHCELEQVQTQLEESNQARCELSKADEELQTANKLLTLENDALQRTIGIQTEKRERMGELLRKELTYFMGTNGETRGELTSLRAKFEQQQAELGSTQAYTQTVIKEWKRVQAELESTQAYTRTVQEEWKRVQAELESTQAYTRTVQEEWKRVQAELESTQAYTRTVEEERNKSDLHAKVAEENLKEILESRSYKLCEPLRKIKKYIVHIFKLER